MAVRPITPVLLAPADTSAQLLYAVPADATIATVSVNVLALGAGRVKLQVAIPGNSAVTVAGTIESVGLDVDAVLERAGIVLGPGYRLLVQGSVANSLAVQVWGIEETNA